MTTINVTQLTFRQGSNKEIRYVTEHAFKSAMYAYLIAQGLL